MQIMMFLSLCIHSKHIQDYHNEPVYTDIDKDNIYSLATNADNDECYSCVNKNHNNEDCVDTSSES